MICLIGTNLIKYALSVEEGFAVLELFEAVVVWVLANVVAQFLSLLNQVFGHLFVHLFKHLVHLG